jgi:hypothetical protein
MDGSGEFGVRIGGLAGDHQVRPLAATAQSDLPPDAAACAGNENGLISQVIQSINSGYQCRAAFIGFTSARPHAGKTPAFFALIERI